MKKARDFAEESAALAEFVRKEVRGSSEVDDIVQDSWLRTIQAQRKGPIQNLRAYLRQIARNLVRDRARRVSLGIEVSLPDEQIAAIPSGQSSIEAQLISRDELARIERVIAALPARPREVFRLARLEGLSFAEIGRRLGLSRQTVHEHMIRALTEIQKSVDADFDRP